MLDRKLHKIFRSLLANRFEEVPLASDNYAETDLERLRLSGLFQELGRKIQNSYPVLGGPPSTRTLADRADRDGDTELSLLIQEIATEDFFWGPNFTALVNSYLDDQTESKFREVLANAAQIMDTGLKVGKEAKRGVEDALEYITYESVELKTRDIRTKNIITSETAPDILREKYRIAKEQQLVIYGGTGIEDIDRLTGGIHPGELWLLAGYASHGKTTFAMYWGMNLAVVGGWNIYVYSLEMKPDELWQILGTIHSNNSKFREMGYKPINSRSLISGTLDPEEEQYFHDLVMPDLRTNPNYGRIIVEQPSERPTMQEVWAKAEAQNRKEPLDLIIIDYIALLAGNSNGKNARYDRINENLTRAKLMALSFDRGNGIGVVSPHQISREGLRKAQQNDGVYGMDALADTSEAERTADVAYAIYLDDRLRAMNECLFSPLKNRNGELGEPFRAYCDSRHRIFGNLRQENYVDV